MTRHIDENYPIPSTQDKYNEASYFLSKMIEHLKVSESFIKQKLYNGEFELDKHYFKIGESKILFDRLEIDKWVRAKGKADGKSLCQKQQTLSKYISQRTKGY